VIASAEYRFHLPRAFDMQPTPTQVFGRPFRVAPDRMLGRPDWDLVLKAFVDGARALSNDRFSFEQNETLIGTGIGLELQLKQNFNFQVYWGVALTDVEEQWDAGDNRFHFIFTAMY
jgi:hemolysin activation/secretion protein